MEFKSHHIRNVDIAELAAGDFVISNESDAADLLGNLYFRGFDRVIIYQHHISPDFFILKTGIAGEVLQKFSNYRIRLAIVINRPSLEGQSLQDFIYESNKFGAINFVDTLEEGLEKLS